MIKTTVMAPHRAIPHAAGFAWYERTIHRIVSGCSNACERAAGGFRCRRHFPERDCGGRNEDEEDDGKNEKDSWIARPDPLDFRDTM